MKFLAVFVTAVLAFQVESVTASHPEPRIIKGQDATEGQFPYQVYLVMRADSGYFVGGGSLIGAEWVLTAAHVVDGILDVTVNLGAVKKDSPEVQVTVDAASVIIHPDWNTQTLRNDIALIRIPSVSFTDRIQQVALPPLSDSSDYAGQSGIVSGWGGTYDGSPLPDTLQYAIVPIMSNEECAKSISIDSTTICVKSQEAGICGGDSGGPLVLQSNPILVGITSFNVNGCQSGLPNGFTRVASYLQWVKDNTGISY